jgi:predicted nucleic acid-binding protein
MLVVDAGCLFEALVGTHVGRTVASHLAQDDDHAAPHVVDVETMNVIRRYHLDGRLDETAARQAIEDLEAWPVERFGHTTLIPRAWDLRHNVRGWDAFYVALAEALDATLLTLDERLARASGPRCRIEVPRSLASWGGTDPEATSAPRRKPLPGQGTGPTLNLP